MGKCGLTTPYKFFLKSTFTALGLHQSLHARFNENILTRQQQCCNYDRIKNVSQITRKEHTLIFQNYFLVCMIPKLGIDTKPPFCFAKAINVKYH